MKRGIAICVLVLVSSGCARMVRAMIGREDPDAVEVRTAASTVLNCPVAQMELPSEDGATEGFDWSATGCDRKAACRPVHKSYECFPVPIPWWASSPSDLVLTVTKLATQTGCPAEKAEVKAVEGYAAITLCQREFACSRDRCEETAESIERTSKQSSIARLALETSCPPEKIHLLERPALITGSERAYRLSACGKDYVCTTNAGRTACKAALDQVPIAAPL